MSRVVALALKDLRILSRDRMGFFWMLGFPLAIALFFGLMFAGEGPASAFPIAIVDAAGTADAEAFARAVEASAAVRSERLDLATAADRVRRGELTAYVRLPPGFDVGAGMFGDRSSAPIEVGIDPSRRAEAGVLEGVLMQASFEVLQARFSDPDDMREQIAEARSGVVADTTLLAEDRSTLSQVFASLDDLYDRMQTPGSAISSDRAGIEGPSIETVEIVAADEGPRSSFEVTFPSGILWGVIGCASTFAVSLVLERTSGTYRRLRAAPLGRFEILAGKGLACFLSLILIVVILLAIGRVGFGIRIANPPAMVIAILAIGVCFVGLMQLVSVVGKTERAVAGAGWAVFIAMAMLGGAMIPLFAMPEWMQTVSDVSPVKWAILSLEGAIWRGFSIAEMARPVAVLVGVGVAAFGIGVARLRAFEEA